MVKKKRIYAFPLLPGKFRGSRPIRRGPDSFALASFTPSYGPIPLLSSLETFRRAKDEWRNLLCHFKSSLPFPCFSSRSFHLSFFANSRFYCSPPRNNDKNSRINTQKRYIRNEKSGVTVQREGERAKEREKKIDGNDEKAKKTTGRNTKDEGS